MVSEVWAVHATPRNATPRHLVNENDWLGVYVRV